MRGLEFRLGSLEFVDRGFEAYYNLEDTVEFQRAINFPCVFSSNVLTFESEMFMINRRFAPTS